MKNIPRIFINNNIETGIIIPASREVAHYLQRVMRTNDFLAFNNGTEYNSQLSADGKNFVIGAPTGRADPAGDVTLMFAPIKRTDDLINMATQMGVAAFQPVITDRTNAAHINWDRMRRVAAEAAEQSNRNSVPVILPPVCFSDLDLSGVVFADERAAHGVTKPRGVVAKSILIGPEGGFSDAEFSALDAAGAVGISLGATILRAEVAAVVALARVVQQ